MLSSTQRSLQVLALPPPPSSAPVPNRRSACMHITSLKGCKAGFWMIQQA